jgi:hypothetical protein
VSLLGLLSLRHFSFNGFQRRKPTDEGQPASLSWCRDPIWNPCPDFCFLSDNCGFLDARLPPWRDDGSVIYSYNCFWYTPEQSLSGPSPTELTTIFYCLISNSKLYSWPVCLGVRHPSQTHDQFFYFLQLFLDSYRFIDVGRPLWREVGSVVFSFCLASQAQPCSGLRPTKKSQSYLATDCQSSSLSWRRAHNWGPWPDYIYIFCCCCCCCCCWQLLGSWCGAPSL